MTLAKCPVGQGLGLHKHLATFETFTVLEGEFLIKWNDDGSEELVLKKHDTISIPPGVCRSFTNIAKEEGLLNDILFIPYAANQMDQIEPNLSKKFEDVGFKFNAGIKSYYPNILAKGTVNIENKVVIINALVIALGFKPY